MIEYKSVSFQPTKQFGQNFLLDSNIARKIVSEAGIHLNDRVMEIGAGFGSLTKVIIEKNSAPILVEINSELVDFLQNEFPTAQVVHQDFLRVDIPSFASNEKINILGNIPYAITSEILFKLIENRQHISQATLMMQLEVANRLIAKPKTKEYGILAVQLQAFSTLRYGFKVSKNVFLPKPTVDSAVISMAFDKKVPLHNEAIFRKFVRTAFRMRRKTVENNVKGIFEISTIPSSYHKKRAEEISVPEFIELSNSVILL